MTMLFFEGHTLFIEDFGTNDVCLCVNDEHYVSLRDIADVLVRYVGIVGEKEAGFTIQRYCARPSPTSSTPPPARGH